MPVVTRAQSRRQTDSTIEPRASSSGQANSVSDSFGAGTNDGERASSAPGGLPPIRATRSAGGDSNELGIQESFATMTLHSESQPSSLERTLNPVSSSCASGSSTTDFVSRASQTEDAASGPSSSAAPQERSAARAPLKPMSSPAWEKYCENFERLTRMIVAHNSASSRSSDGQPVAEESTLARQVVEPVAKIPLESEQVKSDDSLENVDYNVPDSSLMVVDTSKWSMDPLEARVLEFEARAKESERLRIQAENKSKEDERLRIQAENKLKEEEHRRIQAENNWKEADRRRIQAENKSKEDERLRIEEEMIDMSMGT